MKIRILFIVVLAIMVAAGFAATAQAVTQLSYCDTVVFSSQSVAPGTSVEVSGTAPSGPVPVFWDGTQIASLTVTSNAYDGSFTVPADASVGSHVVTIGIPEVDSLLCPFDFTVNAAVSVASTAYSTATLPASLPSTGVMLLVPVVGLAMAGFGVMTMRRRGRN